jgi:hypothetical protein
MCSWGAVSRCKGLTRGSKRPQGALRELKGREEAVGGCGGFRGLRVILGGLQGATGDLIFTTSVAFIGIENSVIPSSYDYGSS